MLIKNAKIFVGKSFLEGDIRFGKTIEAVGRLEGEADWDAKGCYVVPGLWTCIPTAPWGRTSLTARPKGCSPWPTTMPLTGSPPTWLPP